MEVSDRRCNAFKSDLYLARSDTGFGFSLATLGLGAAGAIISDLARSFAVLQTATIGAGVALDENYFNEQSITDIVTKGIDSQRATLRGGIVDARKKDIREYSVKAAIGDALQYHDACTVLSGLKETSETLSARLTDLQKMLQDRVDDLDKRAAEEASQAASNPGLFSSVILAGHGQGDGRG